MRGATIDLEVQTLVADALAGPDHPHDIDGLVEQRVAFLELDAERGELLGEIAGAHTEHDSSAAQPIERRNGFPCSVGLRYGNGVRFVWRRM